MVTVDLKKFFGHFNALLANVLSVLLYFSVPLRTLNVCVVTFFSMATFFSLSLHAQFIRINLDIPTQTSTSESLPLELNLLADPLSGLQTLTGSAIFSITAAENLLVLLQIHAGPLSTELSTDSIPLHLTLAWRNDGKANLPGNEMKTDVKTFFPLSNSGLLIGNMKEAPSLLLAYFFIEIRAGPSQYVSNLKSGNIYVHIEYN